MLINSQSGEKKEKRAFVKYFEIIFSKASKLITLNLVYFSFLIPLICSAIYAMCLLFDISAAVVQSIYFVHLAVWIMETIPLPVMFVLLVLSVVAYGPLTAGFTYCIRNIVTGKPFWMSDMFSQAKVNLKQGLIFGFVDLIVLSSCCVYLASNTAPLHGSGLFMFRTAQVLSVFITVVYFWIRFYSYTIAVTFDLKIKDIFKNCLIFCVLGFFRNIIAMAVSAFIVFTFVSTPRVDIVLIAVLMFSLCRFTVVFSTYPIIEKYMLKAAEKKESKEE